MGWFQKLCRGSGLLLHDIAHAGTKHRVTYREVQQQERQVNETTTLRRTTIDEIEVTDQKKGLGPRG